MIRSSVALDANSPRVILEQQQRRETGTIDCAVFISFDGSGHLGDLKFSEIDHFASVSLLSTATDFLLLSRSRRD